MIEKFLILLPIIPLLGFLLNICLGKTFNKSIVSIIANLSILIPFVFSIIIFCHIKDGPNAIYKATLYDWINVETININLSFFVDNLSSLMLLIVTGIGLLVHIYSIGYMKDDKDYGKYFAYLNLFVAFMLILVLGSSLLVMFIGWEGVGLASYLLIGFWFKNSEYCAAANKAFIMNRIGDAAFLLAIFLIFNVINSVDFGVINEELKAIVANHQIVPYGTVIALLLIIAATGKSAQIPLYTWLPDAMAGPTPVSALMHAATMVTAGIYLILRLNFLFIISPIALSIMAGIGLATALIAATIACTQNDIKKILAYSTVSQLGYMFLALGLGAFSAAFFHLLTHAFFKALLFLGAGSVIHAVHKQDISYMGGLRHSMPITFVTMLVAALALSGIPPLAGFFSKDSILLAAFNLSILAWLVGLITALLTAFYIFRLIFKVFYGPENKGINVRESGISMALPMIILAIFSIVIGFTNVPQVLGGTEWLSVFLEPVFVDIMGNLTPNHMSHLTEYILMILTISGSVISIVIAYKKYIYGRSKMTNVRETPHKGIEKVAYNQFYIDAFYNNVFVKPLNNLSLKIPKFIDRFIIDGIINSIISTIRTIGSRLRFIQNGKISYYLISMVFFLAIVLFILNYFLTHV